MQHDKKRNQLQPADNHIDDKNNLGYNRQPTKASHEISLTVTLTDIAYGGGSSHLPDTGIALNNSTR